MKDVLCKSKKSIQDGIDGDCVTLPMFSYFSKPIWNKNPLWNIDLIDAYNLIGCEKSAWATNNLREIEDHKRARKYKKKYFDYVTFSGTFSSRNDKGLINHSGLLTIDFDDLDDVEGLKIELLQDQCFETELLFISPSGTGVKWIIPIDLTQVCHRDYFRAVSNYIEQTYDLKVDQSGKDISRACFLPHDPDVFINKKYL